MRSGGPRGCGFDAFALLWIVLLGEGTPSSIPGKEQCPCRTPLPVSSQLLETSPGSAFSRRSNPLLPSQQAFDTWFRPLRVRTHNAGASRARSSQSCSSSIGFKSTTSRCPRPDVVQRGHRSYSPADSFRRLSPSSSRYRARSRGRRSRPQARDAASERRLPILWRSSPSEVNVPAPGPLRPDDTPTPARPPVARASRDSIRITPSATLSSVQLEPADACGVPCRRRAAG